MHQENCIDTVVDVNTTLLELIGKGMREGQIYEEELGRALADCNDEEVDAAYKSITSSNIRVFFDDGTDMKSVESEWVDPDKLADEYYLDSPVRTYLKEINRARLSDTKEKAELEKHAALGDHEAEQKLVDTNLYLVISVAKKLSGRGLDFLNLIEAGISGLHRAVSGAAWQQVGNLSAYAVWWIHRAISCAIVKRPKGALVSVYMEEVINKTVCCSRDLAKELGREPAAEEIAAKLNLPLPKIIEAKRIAARLASIDAVSREDEDSILEFFARNEQTAGIMREILNTLRKREADMLKMRLGMYDGCMHPLEEVARFFDMSCVHIRHVEDKVILKLRRYFQMR